MAAPSSRPRPPADPVRQHLVEVRRGLLRLHKALIDSERAVFERGTGPMSNGQFLQALIQDPFFEWLRPFSSLIVEIDETLADKEGIPSGRARAYAEQVRALIEPTGEEAERYAEARQRDAGVLMAHVTLSQRIEGAPHP